MAISPFDNGMYILNSTAKTVDYYGDRRAGEGLTPTLSDVTTPFNTTGTLAGVYAGILVDNFTAFEGLMAVPQNSYDNIAAYNELQACENTCSDIRVKEAAAYFVNNKAFVFDPMETMGGGSPANDDVFDKNQLMAYRNQQQALLTPTPTTTKTATYNATTQTASGGFALGSRAITPTGIAVSRATGKVYVLDCHIDQGTPLLNIYVYDPAKTSVDKFVETLSFDVSNSQFANAGDRLVSQTGQVMRLTLDEKYSQFYVHVENNGRIYQFGVDKAL
jgi:DNA-binding beta-propeller fold protein YncE